MHFHHEVTFLGVGRHLESIPAVGGGIDVRARSLHHERTSGIVASRGAHSLHESLVIAVEHRHQLGMAATEEVILLERFVHAGEEQVLVVILELVGNLCPQLLEHGDFGNDGGF